MEWEQFAIRRILPDEIGGEVIGPLGFCVREIVLPHRVCPQPLSERNKGSYTWGILVKYGVDTLTAVSELSSALKAPVYYAGLKDAISVSSQYAAVRGEVRERVIGKKWAFIPKGKTWRQLNHDYLWGNRFHVQVSGFKRLSPLDSFLNSRAFPNFFGPQRFGTRPPYTHELGVQILRGEEPDELKEMRPLIRKKVKELAIQALQSYLFNLILKDRIERGIDLRTLERGDLVAPLNVFGLPAYSQISVSEGGRLRPDQALLLPVPGSGVKGPGLDLAHRTLKDLGVDLPPWARGWYREAIMIPLSPSYSLAKKRLYLSFELHKAQYASVLLYQLIGGKFEIPKAQDASYPSET
ncbi:MAG: tRNA pseudouridine(13) synthase TruD [Thermoprotei archaeon]